MAESPVFDRMMSHLRATCKYYTVIQRILGNHELFILLPSVSLFSFYIKDTIVVVAFTIRGNYTKYLDKVLEEAAAEFYPRVKFMRVECPKYPGFCITRQRKEYPFVEIFHSPEQAPSQGRVADPNITKYAVKVLPFNYDQSAYGFREFFKRHGIRSSDDAK